MSKYELSKNKLTPAQLAELVNMIEDEEITMSFGKRILSVAVKSGLEVRKIKDLLDFTDTLSQQEMFALEKRLKDEIVKTNN